MVIGGAVIEAVDAAVASTQPLRAKPDPVRIRSEPGIRPAEDGLVLRHRVDLVGDVVAIGIGDAPEAHVAKLVVRRPEPARPWLDVRAIGPLVGRI